MDLRNGPLSSPQPLRPIASSLRTCLLAGVILQLAVIAAAFFRGLDYRSQAAELVGKQQESFQRAFPDDPIPVGIVSRLESEHRRLAGTRGMTNQNVPKLDSAIPVTHILLSALPEPTEVRFKIDRIEIVPEAVAFASGTAKSYGDLETIAERLRLAGLDVPPLSATKTSHGVTLRLEQVRLSHERTD
jgi:hypothetical protein